MPGAADRAIFNGTPSNTIFFTANATVGDVLFSANASTSSTFWRASNFTWTVANSFIFDQPTGATAEGIMRHGTVTVTNSSGTGAFKVGDSTTGGIGRFKMEKTGVGAEPQLIVDTFTVTSNSTWTFQAGTLTTLYGSTLDRGTNATFDGLGALNGDTATWNILGGTNTVNFSGVTGNTKIGAVTGAKAKVNVSGSNTTWTVGGDRFSIGFQGVGQLVISNGARVTSGSARLGDFSTASSTNSTVIVTGANSEWNVNGSLIVGRTARSNILTIANGGKVISASAIIGDLATASNSIVNIVDGTWVVTNATGNAGLVVGKAGQGTLNFNGGTVTVDQLFVTNGAKSVVAWSKGTLNTRGSVVSNGSVFVVGNGVDAAVLNLLSATETNTFFNGLNLATNSFLTGSGRIVGNVNNAGTIAPGNSPGILNVDGNLTLTPSSVLSMELAGTNSSLIDQIDVTGTIFADGTLRILLSAYTPVLNDSFDVLDFASISGVFATLDLPTLSSGLGWDTSNLYTLGSLSVIPEPSAYGLLALGGLLIAAWKRRQKSNAF